MTDGVDVKDVEDLKRSSTVSSSRDRRPRNERGERDRDDGDRRRSTGSNGHRRSTTGSRERRDSDRQSLRRDKETPEEREERKRKERERREKETPEEREERKRREKEEDRRRDSRRSQSCRHLSGSGHREDSRRISRHSSRDGDVLRRSQRSDRDKDRDRDRDKDGDKERSTDRDRDRDRRRRHEETREQRDERKRKEKEEKEKEEERRKEREGKREKDREERRRKDEELKKKRESMRAQRQEEKSSGGKRASIMVNRAELRQVSKEKFADVYRLGRQIYKGEDTRVHVCHHRTTGTERCVKITPKKSSACHEFDMLKNMDHPNILSMYELFAEECDFGFEWYLVIDLCKGKSLYYYLQKRSCKPGKEIMEEKALDTVEDDFLGLGGLMAAAGAATEELVSAITGDEKVEEIEIQEGKYYGMDETEVKQVMLQVMSCINYLHKNNLVHADIKPQNLIMASGIDISTLKLLDFDNSAYLRRADDKISVKKGTPEYMAPEVHAGNKYDYKCDIWSAGVMCYQLLTNSLPFGDSKDISEEEIATKVEEGKYTIAGPSWGGVSEDAKDFVRFLLVLRDKKRPTADKALVHKWLAGAKKEGGGSSAAPALKLNKNAGAMNAMSNFRNFKADTKLKKATCAFIATQLLTKEEKDKIDEVFRAIDITRDGRLSKTEVKAGFFQIFGTFLSDGEIDDMFSRVDCDGTGEIEYSEFVIASMSETDLLSKERLKKAFQIFDKDNSGSITISEFREIFSFFQTAGADMDDEYIDKVIAQVDKDGDGDVSFDEFCSMMTNGMPL